MAYLKNWQRSVIRLTIMLQEIAAPSDEKVEDKNQEQLDAIQTLSAVLENTSQNRVQQALRMTFHRDFLKQLYSDADDISLFSQVTKELKQEKRELEDGADVIQHLDALLINVASSDFGETLIFCFVHFQLVRLPA